MLFQCILNPLNPAGWKTGLTEKPYRPERPANRPSGLPSLPCKLVYRTVPVLAGVPSLPCKLGIKGVMIRETRVQRVKACFH